MTNRRDKDELLRLLTPKKVPEVTHPGYRPAGTKPTVGIVVDGLRRAITRHLARHHVPELRAKKPARFLLIQGPPGEGKTTSVAMVCAAEGVDLLVVHADELASAHEGGASAAMAEIAEAVRVITRRSKRQLVLQLDDFDLSTAVTMTTAEGTCNGPLLVAVMHNMADHGYVRDHRDIPVPVIITGNDFTAARATLFRPGRANLFTFAPMPAERVPVVATMFPSLSVDEVSELVERRQPGQSVAFFGDCLNALLDEDIDALVAHYGLDAAAISAELNSVGETITFARVCAVADRLAAMKLAAFV